MSLHEDILIERCDHTFLTETMRLNVANSTWVTTDDAATIIESEILDDRITATTVTCTYNATLNVMEFLVAGPITTPVNTSITFNRIIAYRGGQSQVVWTGTEGGTTFTLGNPNPFVTGDRIVYDGSTYVLDNSVGQVITVNSGPFTQGENEIRDASGLITIASVLPTADTTFIPANSSITLSLSGQSVAGVV